MADVKEVEETYELPDNPRAASTFVNELQRKGYRVKNLTTSHVVVIVPAAKSPQEGSTGKKQLLQD